MTTMTTMTTMTVTPQRRLAHRWQALATLAACALVAVPSWLQAATPASPAAATPSTASAAKSAEATYREARAVCLSGRSQQDSATCLKEAGAVLAEQRGGRTDNSVSAAMLRANALKRCEAQPPQARDECARLARGEGSQEGTVKGGGVIKEIVTQVPAVVAPAAAKR